MGERAGGRRSRTEGRHSNTRQEERRAKLSRHPISGSQKRIPMSREGMSQKTTPAGANKKKTQGRSLECHMTEATRPVAKTVTSRKGPVTTPGPESHSGLGEVGNSGEKDRRENNNHTAAHSESCRVRSDETHSAPTLTGADLEVHCESWQIRSGEGRRKKGRPRPGLNQPGVLVTQLVSRHSCVADRLSVVVRFPAGPRVSLKW